MTVILQALSSASLVLWIGLLASWLLWHRQAPGTRGRYLAKSWILGLLYPAMMQMVVPGIRDAVMGTTGPFTYAAACLTAIAWLVIRGQVLRDGGDNFFDQWRALFLRPSPSN